MKKYALLTTHYCINCICSTKEQLISRFNYDGDIDDLYINFSDKFDPWHKDDLVVGATGRKDLVYGKIFLLRDFIKNNISDKYEYICHIDYNDTRFCRSYVKMMEEFISTGDDFIISTEKNCWPPLDIVKTWANDPLEEKEFFYINSGAIIAKTNIYYEYLTYLSQLCTSTNIDFWDDQGVWQYYNLYIDKLNADETCKYFFSTALLDDSYYTIENTTLKTKFGTYPYLIHDNSSFSLGLTARNLFMYE
jgi:hypothetical protein